MTMARIAQSQHARCAAQLLLLAALWACGSDDASGVVEAGGAMDGGPAEGSGQDATAGGDAALADAGDIVERPDAPENTAVVETVLDYVPLDLLGGVSGGISFEVPENTVSVVVLAEGEQGISFTLHSWVDASGEPLVPTGWWDENPFEPSAPSLCLGCANRPSASEGVFASLAPNNEASFVTPGTHSLSVLGYAIEGRGINAEIVYPDTQVNLTVLAKVMPELPDTGTLDLNLYFTGAGGWTAATATQDFAFLQLLGEVQDVYDAVGLELGEITYTDIDASFEVIEGFDGPGNDLGRLFAQSVNAPDNAANVFFVAELLQGGPFGEFGVVLGISGGIPGPSLVQGTTKNGVAIALDSHERPDIGGSVATTFAHELGHYLGLFHTSEVDFGFGQQLHDPLADTPENDASYLMFNSGSGSRLSPWQGIVMRSNPWVRHP